MSIVSDSVWRYYPLISLAVDIHPIAHAFDVGERYTPLTHMERLRQLRRHLLKNPNHLPPDVEDKAAFLATLTDLRFTYDQPTDKIIIGTSETVKPITKISKNHGLAGTLDDASCTKNHLSAVCYVLQHGLATMPFLLRNPSQKTIELLTSLLTSYPDLEIIPHEHGYLLL